MSVVMDLWLVDTWSFDVWGSAGSLGQVGKQGRTPVCAIRVFGGRYLLDKYVWWHRRLFGEIRYGNKVRRAGKGYSW
jgi:hypothetical protein